MSDAKKPAKSIDVTHADDSAEDDKPTGAVIITNHSILKSPSTAPTLDGNSGDAPAEPVQRLSGTVKKAIKPLDDSPSEPATIKLAADKPGDTDADESKNASGESLEDKSDSAPPADADTSKDEAPKEEAPKSDDKPPESPPESKPESAPAPDDADSDADDDAAGDSDAKKTGPSDEELEAEAQAKAKHDEAVQKLIDGKQYFLPINAVEKRRTKNFVLLGLVVSLLLILAWGDIALDAGLITVPGVKPVTHFFSN